MNDCVFCNTEAVKDSIYQTQNFYVRVGIGLIAPGHVLIIPKEHYKCFAELPEHLEPELVELKRGLQKKVTEEFATPFLIEYGVWGQTVNHAHIQVVPSRSEDYEIESLIQEMVVPGGIRHEARDMRGLKEVLEKEQWYVSIEEKGTLYVCHIDGIDYENTKLSKHLRYRLFFEKTKGIKGASSWSAMSDEDKENDEKERDLTKRLLTS